MQAMANQKKLTREDDEPLYRVPKSVFCRGSRQSRYQGPGLVVQCEREAARFYREQKPSQRKRKRK